ncbi:MAG: hypothetical protein ACI8XZ_001831 [Gammaproteobacteria bacterium]|jgi:hypothetical protein
MGRGDASPRMDEVESESGAPVESNAGAVAD